MMEKSFIDPISQTANNFYVNGQFVVEETSKREKRQKELFSNREGQFTDYIGSIGSQFLEKNVLQCFDENINIPEIELQLEMKAVKIMGDYQNTKRRISYYSMQGWELEITRIHERYHALHHLIPDQNGHEWKTFGKASAFCKELLAQLFTFHYCKFKEPSLLPAFINLEKDQPLKYQTWKIFQKWPVGKAIDLYWEIRRRIENEIGLGTLDEIGSNIGISKFGSKRWEFERGINNTDFIKALNNEYNKADSWWKKIADENRNLFIAIRKESLNVYHKGNSLIEISYRNNELKGKTHPKFLIGGDVYVTSINGKIDQNEIHKFRIYSDFGKNLNDIILASNAYAKEEKEGSYKIILTQKNIVDVEIAFGESERAQIDFAAFRRIGNKPKLFFYEVKRFDDDRLRSKKIPKVITDQLAPYTRLIATHLKSIKKSYQTIIDNMKSLKGNYFKDKAAMIGNIVDFEVSDEINIVVFGFDTPQKKDWLKKGGQFEKLCSCIGDKNRIIKMQNPGDIAIPY